jgi:hypothetical protein
MPVFSIGERLRIALGGFVAFTGFIVLIFVALALTNTASFIAIFEGAVLAFVISVVAILNVACGLLLFFSDKQISLSFPSHKKKPNDDTD